jgi:hypothetical protein
MDAALAARDRSLCRQALESRLAFSLANPPPEGNEKRILRAEENGGIRVEESLVDWPLKDGKGRDVTGIKKLLIVTSRGRLGTDRAEVLVYHP